MEMGGLGTVLTPPRGGGFAPRKGWGAQGGLRRFGGWGLEGLELQYKLWTGLEDLFLGNGIGDKEMSKCQREGGGVLKRGG